MARPGSFLMPRAAAGLAFTLICVLLMAGIVAASGPGDLAYGLRIAVEQIPARLTPDAEAWARAELRIASHRLAELDRTMSSQDQVLDERTISALVADVEMAAGKTAASLSEPERIEIAARNRGAGANHHPTCGVCAQYSARQSPSACLRARISVQPNAVLGRAGVTCTPVARTIARTDKYHHRGAARHLSAPADAVTERSCHR